MAKRHSFYSLLHASSLIVHTWRLTTVTVPVPTTVMIYGQSAHATSSYQRSEDFSGNQPDPLSGFIRLHWRARLIVRAPVKSNTPSSLPAATQPANPASTHVTVSAPTNQSSRFVCAPSQEPTLWGLAPYLCGCFSHTDTDQIPQILY
jgi:hypothetical protein